MWLPAHSPPPLKAPTGAFPEPGPGATRSSGLRIPTAAHSLGPSRLPPQALTLLGVWGHFLHELNEVSQELGIVV